VTGGGVDHLLHADGIDPDGMGGALEDAAITYVPSMLK
jgi:hypothetical protein